MSTEINVEEIYTNGYSDGFDKGYDAAVNKIKNILNIRECKCQSKGCKCEKEYS